MDKCDKYHQVSGRGYRYDPATGRPIPYANEYGVCFGTKTRERCDCDGDTSRCDFYPEKRKAGRGCGNCRRYKDDVDTCRLLNCHRAYGQKELENKDFVTDAWEPST